MDVCYGFLGKYVGVRFRVFVLLFGMFGDGFDIIVGIVGSGGWESVWEIIIGFVWVFLFFVFFFGIVWKVFLWKVFWKFLFDVG